MQVLKPCRFCGAGDRLHVFPITMGTKSVCCGRCGAQGPSALNEPKPGQSAEDKWNAPDPSKEAPCKR